MKRFVKRPSPAMLVAFLALVVALGGTALARDALPAKENAVTVGNVKLADDETTLTNGSVESAFARCPNGTRVFAGSYNSTGLNTRIINFGASRKANGYLATVYLPPVNLAAGVVNETATVTVVAWCGPVGKPIVLK